jgi:hypothetical protein
VSEVKGVQFPEPEHYFGMKDDEFDDLLNMVG